VTTAASVDGRDRIRLFVALVLPDDTVEALVAWQRATLSAAGDVRGVPPGNLHVTLAGLGPRPRAELRSIVRAVRDAASRVGVPELTAARYRETRSVGMVVLDDAGGRAAALADDVQRRLEEIGVYEREQRRWLPHVTVVRFRRPPRLGPGLPGLGRVSPSEAAVYHSVLRPGGAQYVPLESVPLGG
jgi:2'-5' RNA ligase